MPEFQRRHYIYIAQWAAKEGLDLELVKSLADHLQKTNPGFKRFRFIAACQKVESA